MRRWLASIFVDCAQQFADSLGFRDRGAMFYLNRCECPAKVGGRIALGPACSNGISEYLTRPLLCPERRQP
jgi:hypothetical protein